MINSKLIRLIKALSKVELQGLKIFLSSPFFNTNPSIIKFYEILLKIYPNFKPNNTSKEHLHQLVYPDKPFNDSSFRNLILSFTKLIEEYIKQIEIKKNDTFQDHFLLKAFSERSLKTDFDHLFFKRLNSSKNSPPKDGIQHLEQYLILKAYYHFPETERREMDADFSSQTLHHLNQFFVLSETQLAIEIASRKKVLKEKAPVFHFKDSISTYASNFTEQSQPLLKILLLLEEFYANHSKQALKRAITLFKLYHQRFSLFDKKVILTVLINQMNQLFIQGQEMYLNKIHQLYQFGLSEGILLFNNSLTSLDYLNIVTTASRNKKTSWAIDFIQEYAKYLPKKDKAQVKALANATVQYDLGNYQTVIDLLSPYSFRKSPFGLRFRFITVKAYIEIAFIDTSYVNTTETFIRRMEQYINRGAKKRRTDQSLGFINFLEIVRLILNVCINKDKRIIKKIKPLIKTKQPIIAKNWLLQKVNDLEQL